MPAVSNLTDLPATAPAAQSAPAAQIPAPAAAPVPQPVATPPATVDVVVPRPGDDAVAAGLATLDAEIAALNAALPVDVMPASVDTLPTVQQGVTYLANNSNRSGNYQMLADAGIPDGGYYLSYRGEIIGLNPLRFWLYTAMAWRTLMESDGAISFASRDLKLPTGGARKNEYDEHYVALLFVDLPDGRIVPTKADIRTTKCGALAPAIDLMKDAATPAFPTRGEAYAIAARFPQPFGRVYTTATVAPRMGKNPYHKAYGRSQPTPIGAMERLAAAFTNDDFKADLADAAKNVKDRINELMDIEAASRTRTGRR